jgi:hypothetical protein
MVLGDAPVPHLVEAEDTLQDAEGMLDLGPYTRLTPILLFLYFIHIVLELCALTGHVLGFWSGLFDRLCVALIAAVAPHLALFAVQQVGQHVLVMALEQSTGLFEVVKSVGSISTRPQ